MVFKPLIISTALVVAGVGTAIAGGHGGNPAVKARKAHMQLYGFNLGVIGAMAKGDAEYNADAATAAANNIVALSGISQMAYWPQGTDNEALGDETRALPALWADFPGVIEKATAVTSAAEALAAVAGDGQAALGPALGALGGACTACHKDYRQSDN